MTRDLSQKVVFRVDASVDIGTGHVMRCLTLANALKARGADCEFVCREHAGHLADRIESAGHDVHLLPSTACGVEHSDPADGPHAHWLGCSWRRDAGDTLGALGDASRDWLIVDHYALDRRWESELRPLAAKMMVIDDLADRPHCAHVLVDQNLGRSVSHYARLVEDATRCLVGPDFALLRPEFVRLRDYSLARRSGRPLQEILVSLGGVDRLNVSELVLDSLAKANLPRDVRVTVILGPRAPNVEMVRAAASRMEFDCEVRVDVADMAEAMANADLAIGAAGSSSWERCALGLPSVTMVLAENQRGVAEALDRIGAAIVVVVDDRMPQQISSVLTRMIDPGIRAAYSLAASAIVDGRGTERVVSVMEALG